MKQSKHVKVTGPGGIHGTIDPSAPADPDGHVQITLEDGRILRISKNVLHEAGPNHFTIAIAADEIDALTATAVVPVVHEEIAVDKKTVESGRVRIRKVIHTEQQTVDEPLAREEVTVERVPVERLVEQAPPHRHEGDALVIPVVEEILVIEKRLMLKEELWVRKRKIEERRPETHTLRREEAVIERLPARPAHAQGPAPSPDSTARPPGAAAPDGTTIAKRPPSRRR